MKMTRSREILAIILQVLVTAFTAVLIFSFVMNLTVASHNYYSSKFPVTMLSAEAEKQLETKYEMLSKETGFPTRVFMKICEDTPTSQNVKKSLDNALASGDGSLYSTSLLDYFNTLCEDYAKGNNIDYDSADINMTAQKAAKIYNETVSVSGMESAERKQKELRSNVTFSQFISLVAIVVCSLSLVLIHARKRLSITRILCGIEGGGISALLASLLLRVVNPVLSLDIKPQIFLECLSEMTDKFFTVTALVSVAFIAVSLIIMINIEAKYEKKKKDEVKIS
ncbi:MAG: hypothetical protein IKF64_02885 [Eubacterium sp.]|nr:hypothetical protein [Eubacterium sp.]